MKSESADPAEASRRLHALVTRLRRECPWDREQTHASLAPYALEEAAELAAAQAATEVSTEASTEAGTEAGEPSAAVIENLVEELGDVLLQVYLNAAIAEQAGTFRLVDIYEAVEQKMIRRHPHVFERSPDEPELTEEQLAEQWARIKASERQQREQRQRRHS